MPVIKARCNVLHLLDETRFLTEHIEPPEATELTNLKK
jgi:hypothetical protein